MDEELHQFARWGNRHCYINKVKELIDQGVVDVDHRGYFGQTALHEAAAGGHIALVKVLTEEYFANVDATNDRSETPLWLAAERGHLGILSYLIEKHNANTNATDTFKRTPLHIASVQGQYEIALYLLETHYHLDTAVDFMGRTPLHLACSAGNADIVKLLLHHGSNVNATTHDTHGSCTPLHVAAAATSIPKCDNHDNKIVAVIHVLLSHDNGSHPLCVSNSGDTPLHLASSKAIAKALLEHDCSTKRVDCQVSVSFMLLSALNRKNETPVQAINNRSRSSPELKLYLDSFVSSTLTVSTPLSSSSPSPSNDISNCTKEAGVVLNPSLDPFQMSLAWTLCDLLHETLIHPVATVVLGYLTPMDVTNQPTTYAWHRIRAATIMDDGTAFHEDIEYSC
jgi:ankyrin repeat protein